MANNFNSWIARFKKHDKTNSTEVALPVATEDEFHAQTTGTIIVRDDGVTYEKNAKGAWEKASTVATDVTFGGVKVEWVDATTVNIITK